MLTKDQENHIIYLFDKVDSKESLLHLLYYAKRILYGDKCYPFKLNQLAFYSNPKVNPNRYYQFGIFKKSGQVRIIHAPVKGLKAIQRSLNLILQCKFKPHPAATGFTNGKSIVENAQVHTGNYYVYNIDLKDFFFSIDQARIWKCLQLNPFLLGEKLADNDANEHWNEDKPKKSSLVNIISALCCTSIPVIRKTQDGVDYSTLRNVLPQGAPTSPLLTNVVCNSLDRKLSGVAKRFGLKYSRYADDITFSSLHNVYQTDSPFLSELEKVITLQGFVINDSKVRLQKQGYRQVVTGLTVNQKVNVSKSYIKKLRQWLYLWETYGYSRAHELFSKDLIKMGKTPVKNLDMFKVLDGKLAFLKQVKGIESPVYKSLKIRLEALSKKEKSNASIGVPEKKFNSELLGRLVQLNTTLTTDLPIKELDIENLKSQIESLQQQLSLAISLSTTPLVDIADAENVYHDPKFTVQILNKFSEETNLKYTTHLWDDDNRYEDYSTLKRAILDDVYAFGIRLLPKYNAKLYWNLIYPFIIQDQVRISQKGIPFKYQWGKYKIKIGYNYPEAVNEWMLANPNTEPFSMPIPKHLQPKEPIKGKTVVYFEDVVDIFKSSIEFRKNDLFYMFKSLTQAMNFDFNITLAGLKGLTFYTDTFQIERALNLIFQGIRKYTEHPKVQVLGSYNDIDKAIVIEIMHYESYCDKRLDDEKLNLIDKKGDFSNIRNYFSSLCDWSIESRFRINNDFKYFRFNYLNSEEFKGPIPIETIAGFKHILKFYV